MENIQLLYACSVSMIILLLTLFWQRSVVATWIGIVVACLGASTSGLYVYLRYDTEEPVAFMIVFVYLLLAGFRYLYYK